MTPTMIRASITEVKPGDTIFLPEPYDFFDGVVGVNAEEKGVEVFTVTAEATEEDHTDVEVMVDVAYPGEQVVTTLTLPNTMTVDIVRF